MKKRSAQKWLTVLQACGVQERERKAWAPVFSEFFEGNRFSKGESELVPFLANILHESSRLRKTEEALSYSAKRMCEVWPSRFKTIESAKPYEHHPVALAGKVYGGRLGNRGARDGWDYRGSGLIMITGRANFEFVQNQIGIPIVEKPDLLREPGPAALAAALAWWEGNVPDSVIGNTTLTRAKVNGGDIGLVDVRALTNILESELRK